MPAIPPLSTAARRQRRLAVRHAFCGFVCILASYFLLLPLREEAILATGTERLPQLFLASLIATIVVSPLTAAVTAAHPAGKGHRLVLRCFALVLFGLYVLSVTTSSSSTSADVLAASKSGVLRLNTHVSAILFVTVNLINVVATSTHWQLCATCFSSKAATERFGLLSAGATCGQLAGSAGALLVTRLLLQSLTLKRAGGLPAIMLVSACLMLLAARCMALLVRCTHPPHPTPPPDARTLDNPRVTATLHQPQTSFFMRQAAALRSCGRAITLHIAKAKQTAHTASKSPYVLLAATHVGLSAMSSSLLYFERALVVTRHLGSQSRLTFFATINSLSAVLILILQLMATPALIRGLGVQGALCISPCLSVAGFIVIAAHPTPYLVAGVEVVRKMAMYSLGKPTREVLFTVLSPEELSSKVVVDSLVCRLGDSLAAGVFEILEVKLAWGPRTLAIVGAVLCLVWAGVAYSLGSGFRKRQHVHHLPE